MSSAVFSHLPRFNPAADRQPAEWLRALTTPEAAAAPVAAQPAAAAAAAPVAAPAPVAAAPSVPTAAESDAALEAGVKALSGLVSQLEAEARAEAAKTIRALASELLPELSRQFMADEIMRHLPALVPGTAVQFEIKAAPAVAERIAELAAQHPALAGRFSVTPEAGQSAGAEISWRTGGVTFDFDSLLSACLARLNTTSSQTME